MKDMIPRTNADEYCRKLKPRDKPLDIHDSQVKGLVFQIMPTGSKIWILRYHFKEGDEWKQRKTGLGPFRQGTNDVSGLTVPSARIEAERIKNEVKYKGKTKGTKNKATVVAEMLLQGELENICRRLIQEAITGNMQAIKMVLDRVLPAKKDTPIVIDLPKLENSSDALQAIASITIAVSEGTLTVSEGESLSRIIDIYVRAIEIHNCEIRINRVEQKAIL